MQNTKGRIIWTIVFAIIAGVLQYVVRQVLEAWGILDPFAKQLGTWLDTHITAPQIGWTIATTLAVAVYIVALWFVWSKNRHAATTASNKPLAEASPPQQDLQIEHRFHGDSGHAELVLRNTSTQHALENVEVTFANFSIEEAPYTPIDVLSRLKARPRGAIQDTINAKDQKYYRFARVHPTQDERKYRISLWNVSEDAFSGKGCIVKFRISTKQSPAKLVYLRLSVDDTGHLTVSDYKRNKPHIPNPNGNRGEGGNEQSELIALPEAVSIAFDRIRDAAGNTDTISFQLMNRLDGIDQRKIPYNVCQTLFNGTNIPLFGIYPPSRQVKEIPREHAESFMFSDDASEMFNQWNRSERYHSVAVRRSDLEQRLREIT